VGGHFFYGECRLIGWPGNDAPFNIAEKGILMDLLFVSMIIFLLIFSATAVLTLLSLIGKVKIAPNYQKQLFRLLLLEVVGVVIGFVANGLKPDQATFLTEKVLLNNQNSWDWCYPENSSRTSIRFEQREGALVLIGTTYTVSNGKKIPVIDWKSDEPVKPDQLSKSITFRASRKWRKEALQFKPELAYEVDKWVQGSISLNTDLSLRGSFKTEGSELPWGIMMTRAWN
jgi:hypothetical protein